MHTRSWKCRSHRRAPSLVHFPCVAPSKLCLASAQAHVSLSSSVNVVYLTHLSLVRSAEEIARSIPAARSHTPLADPESNPRAATPEPEGSKSVHLFTTTFANSSRSLGFRARNSICTISKKYSVPHPRHRQYGRQVAAARHGPGHSSCTIQLATPRQ